MPALRAAETDASSSVEGRGQRRFVHDAAARHVDQDGRRLHQRQFARADQIARAVVQRGVDRHHVGPSEQFVERLFGIGFLAHDARGRGIGDAASQRLGDAGDAAADVAQPDDAPFRAVKLVCGAPEVVLQGRSCICGLDVAVVIDRLSQQADGRADGGLRHGVGRVAHGIFHRNAQFGRGLEVDVVHAGRRHADQPQAGELSEGFAAENHLVGDHHVGFAAAVGDLFADRGPITRVVAQRADGPEVGVAERVFVQKYDVRLHILCVFVNCVRRRGLGSRMRIRSAAL